MKKIIKEKIIKENFIKNIILMILLIIIYFLTHDYLVNGDIVTDKVSMGYTLIATSVMAVIASTGNFAFTYEKINVKSTSQRYLAHFTTGLLMLVIGASLIFTGILISLILGHFILIDVMLLLLYVACIAYDFWDLLRLFVV